MNLAEPPYSKSMQKFTRIPVLDSKSDPTVKRLKLGKQADDKEQCEALNINRDVLEKAGVRIKPDCAYLLIVTTGAGDYFGPNLKADYYHESPKEVDFPEAPGVTKNLGPGLKDKHFTFLTSKGIFRHHNYDNPPEGNIVWERYNTPMHRGEVISELPLKYWSEDLDRYEKGQPLLFSQGSQVKSDICSRCAFEFTPSTPERCYHMRKKKLEICDDGGQVFVYNPDPEFYELSEVGSRPADKIAFCLKKVADTGDSSEELSKTLNIPRRELRILYAVPSSSEKRKALQKLKKHWQRMSIMPNKTDVSAISSCSMGIPEKNQISGQLSALNWKDLLPVLRKLNCMLTPQIFQDILTSNESRNIVPDVRELEEAVNFCMENMSLDQEESILDDTSYSSLIYPSTEAAKSLLLPVSTSLSLDPVKAALRPAKSPKVSIIIKKGSEGSSIANFMAREYIKYQAEALTELGPDNDGAAFLAAANLKSKLSE